MQQGGSVTDPASPMPDVFPFLIVIDEHFR